MNAPPITPIGQASELLLYQTKDRLPRMAVVRKFRTTQCAPVMMCNCLKSLFYIFSFLFNPNHCILGPIVPAKAMRASVSSNRRVIFFWGLHEAPL